MSGTFTVCDKYKCFTFSNVTYLWIELIFPFPIKTVKLYGETGKISKLTSIKFKIYGPVLCTPVFYFCTDLGYIKFSRSKNTISYCCLLFNHVTKNSRSEVLL
jgi:hypothetical protein